MWKKAERVRERDKERERERGRKMEGSDKTLLTSKSLSNLIGVIESFQLLCH